MDGRCIHQEICPILEDHPSFCRVMYKCLWLCTALVIVMLSACDGPDELLRSNESDPGSNAFIPSGPQSLTASPQRGRVRLTWHGGSKFADSVLVERALAFDGRFERIAMLPPGSTTYVDDRGAWAREMRYRVSLASFREGIMRTSEEKTADVRVEGVISNLNLQYHTPDSIRVSFEASTNIGEEVIILQDMPGGATELARVGVDAQSAILPLVVDGFENQTYHVRLVSADYLIDEKSTVLDARRYCRPRDVQVHLLNEVEVRITWEHPCPNDVSFRIAQDVRLVSQNPPFKYVPEGTSETILEARLTDGRRHNFTVQSIHESVYSDHSDPAALTHSIRTPEITGTQIDGNHLRIKWEHESELTREYVISRKAGDDPEASVVGRVGLDERHFEYTLDPANGRYQFTVSTLTSRADDVDLEFQAELVEVSRIVRPAGEADALAVSFDNDFIVTAGRSSQASATFTVHTPDGITHGAGVVDGFITDIAVSDVDRLVAFSLLETGVEVRRFDGTLVQAFAPRASRLAFSRSGAYFGVSDGTGSLRVYDVSDWSLRLHHGASEDGSGGLGVAFSPDETLVLWPHGWQQIARYDLDAGISLQPLSTGFMPVRLTYSRDGHRLFAAAPHPGGGAFYTVPEYVHERTLTLMNNVDINSDGRIAAGFTPVDGSGHDFLVYAVEDDRVLVRLPVQGPRMVRFLSDDRLALATEDGDVRILRIGDEAWVVPLSLN
jgi:hypothetical protein